MKIKVIFSLILLIIASLYAIYTDHRWEDWYITYKSAKNLALGHGLVYHAGERLMTFTSPIGVLLPASIKYLFLDYSDDLVIWLFRLINIIILAIVPFFLIEIFKKFNINNMLIMIFISLFSFNILIIDNTINGMESAFMVFFISYLIFVLFNNPANMSMHLAFSLAGLMYTRPDGFIYGGAIIFSYYLFNIKSFKDISEHYQQIKLFLKPVILALILYLPWFIWSWIYYDTPVSHTIIAKSTYKTYDIIALIKGFLAYNYRVLTFQSDVTGSLFMPAYSWAFKSWNFIFELSYISSFFGIIISFFWINPHASRETRILSLSVYILNFYLARISGQGPMPWYLPSVILPSLLCLVFIIKDLLEVNKDFIRKFAYSLGLFFIIFTIFIFYFGSIQIKAHQDIIEFNNRKQIGLWLNQHATPGDKIFMECLGYIGFFSNLKTFDYPGMSSPEVVSARKELNEFGYDLPKLVYKLYPDWLILRPGELEKTKKIDSIKFEAMYDFVKKFDLTDQVLNKRLHFGEAYLFHDAIFYIYKLKGSPDEAKYSNSRF